MKYINQKGHKRERKIRASYIYIYQKYDSRYIRCAKKRTNTYQ